MAQFTLVPWTTNTGDIIIDDVGNELEFLVESDLRFITEPQKQVLTDEIYFYGAIAIDSLDDTTISISAVVLPSWLQQSEVSEGYLIIQGVPKEENIGVYDVSIEATDGYLTIIQNYQITVIENTNEGENDPRENELGESTILVFYKE